MNKKQIILITGTRKGIGRFLVKHYTSLGYQVIGCSRNETEYSIDNYQHFCLDVCDEKEVKKMFSEIRKTYGCLHILINNAGIASMNHALLTTMDTVHKIYGTNVFGPIQLIQNLMHKFSSDAHIVNISSVGGVTGSVKFPGLSAYSSSKGAMTILTECLQAEFGDSTSWSFNCLALGAVQTEMLEEAFPGYVAPIDAAAMAAYICGFALNNHLVMRGRVVEVAMSTP